MLAVYAPDCANDLELYGAFVSSVIEVSLEKIYIITRCFQKHFMGQMEAPRSWKIVKVVF